MFKYMYICKISKGITTKTKVSHILLCFENISAAQSTSTAWITLPVCSSETDKMAEEDNVEIQPVTEEDEEQPTNYKPPPQKTLTEMIEADKDDESLRKYKETLLGTSAGGAAVIIGECGGLYIPSILLRMLDRCIFLSLTLLITALFACLPDTGDFLVRLDLMPSICSLLL